MKKYFILLVLFPMMIISCKQNKTEQPKEEVMSKENRTVPDFSKGVMTEEILGISGVYPTRKFLPTARRYFLP